MESSDKKWTPPDTKESDKSLRNRPAYGMYSFGKGYKNKDIKAAALKKTALLSGFSVGEIKRKLHNVWISTLMN
jgi:hypothetical protein